jgi:hypothetical protein
MARRVFFSFHYDRDVRRVVQVRNSWLARPGDEAQPFYDKAQFEEAKKRAGGIEKWIEEQLKGTSVTVLLFGAETYDREWVKHEIKRSYQLNKGILAIDIHDVKDPQLVKDGDPELTSRDEIRSNIGRRTMSSSRSSTKPTTGFGTTGIRICQIGSRQPLRQRRVREREHLRASDLGLIL